MAFEIVDVSARMADAEGAPAAEPQMLAQGPGAKWALLRLAPGEHYDDSDAACVERSLLVLEGVGSAVSPERTASVASGMLVLVPTGVALDLRNDSTAPLVVLLATRPRVVMSKESS
jgi:mannose-6-phosphate isomerase-like protein (cupin superfamily)